MQLDAQSIYINAGSDVPYTDKSGNTWVPDTPDSSYVSGGLSFTTGTDIEGTELGSTVQKRTGTSEEVAL